MANYEPGIGDDLVLLEKMAHKMNDVPVFLVERKPFFLRELLGHGLIPVTGIDQVPLIIDGRIYRFF